MRKLILLSFVLFSGLQQNAAAQGFEGSIYFTKSNMQDVTKYAYHVKGNMVRIDEIMDGQDEMVATLLVNLDTEQMMALSHERNLYLERPAKNSEVEVSDAEVKKGSLKRSIHGKECVQYRVRNKDEDREVMFWVTEGDYAFLPRLLRVLKRKDPFARYYLALPELDNKFPVMAEENTLLREKKGFLQVDRMEPKELPTKMFEIPEGFEKVER